MRFLKSKNKNFKEQDYDKLHKEYQEMGTVFTDPLYPTTNASLTFSKSLPARIQWKRPRDICENPRLFVEGASSKDVTQGELGNCWFVAACSVLAGVKELWNKVIPNYKEQEWDPEHPEKYAGIFHFRFWRFGSWIDVVVDDLLPTLDGKLMFIHSSTSNEFWSALLEKAYAKLHGSYEALDGGNLCDALVDFTSGVSQVINLPEGNYTTDDNKRKILFKTMLREVEDHSLMCCAIAATTADEQECRTETGLVKGHAYGITAVREVSVGDTGLLSFLKGKDKIYMIRIRNPWGEKEWNGPFSDGSPEWARISQPEREKLGLTFDDDGEFWMPFEDFVVNFTELSICHLINTSLFTFRKTWEESVVKGMWTTGMRGTSADRAGGCINNAESFLRNPQYRFDVSSDKEEIMIQLSQRDVRDRKPEGATNLVIGLQLLKVEDNRRCRLHTLGAKVGTSDYIKTRSIYFETTLDIKGRYVIVPTAFNPDDIGEFMLRLFTGSDANFQELAHDVPNKSLFPCISYPSCITVVTVKGASDIQKLDTFGTADAYCCIKCEGETVRSSIVKNSLNPIWDLSAVFYRKHMDKPIKIQIWNSNLMMDTFMGQVRLPAPVNHQKELVISELKGRRRKKEEAMEGRITVEVFTEADLLAV